MDRRGGVERGLTAAKGPGPGLGVTRGEEDDQSDRFEDAGQDGLEARRAVAKLGRILGRELRQLGFELQVETALAVDEGTSGFVVSGSRAAGSVPAYELSEWPPSTWARTRSSSSTSLRS